MRPDSEILSRYPPCAAGAVGAFVLAGGSGVQDAHMGLGPYGPGPTWARSHRGLGPHGPGPIWARAHEPSATRPEQMAGLI